ncbi:MAG: hypothetical protein HY671_03370 [Chloroflexi bacterium]|nr:hypothetical protein [Chloroflexota bacterium]
MRTVPFIRTKRRSSLFSEMARWRAAFQLFGWRGWAVAAIGAGATLVLIGVTAGIISNPLFARETPVQTQDYIIWIATALLMGLVAGSFMASRVKGGSGKAAAGGFLSFFATACPICNTLVVSLLGVSGALTYFAPLQLYLGIASVALLLWTLHLRLAAMGRNCCVIPPETSQAQGALSDN